MLTPRTAPIAESEHVHMKLGRGSWMRSGVLAAGLGVIAVACTSSNADLGNDAAPLTATTASEVSEPPSSTAARLAPLAVPGSVVDRNGEKLFDLDAVPTSGIGHALIAELDQVFSTTGRTDTDGLVVTLTLDQRWQTSIDAAVQQVAPGHSMGVLEVWVALIDHQTGEILAVRGDPTQHHPMVNTVRLPILIAALESGRYQLTSKIDGTGPCQIAGTIITNLGEGRGFVGTLTDQALASSLCAFGRVGEELGNQAIADVIENLTGTPIQEDSLLVASPQLGIVDQAAAVGVIANNGRRVSAHLINQVLDEHGTVLYQHTPTTTDTVKPAIASDVGEVLEAIVERGTGTRARLDDKTVLGITGTAQEFTDAWFIGSVDNLTAAIWQGDPINSTSIRQAPGQRGTGGRLPALLWAQLMNTPPPDTP